VPRADYAKAVGAVLTDAGYEGQIDELTRDKGYILCDLADEISRQTGKISPYQA
jgi:NAD(P)H dehydrogenase (quinone)